MMIETTLAVTDTLAESGFDTGGLGELVRGNIVPTIVAIIAIAALAGALRGKAAAVLTIVALTMCGLGVVAMSSSEKTQQDTGRSVMCLVINCSE